MPKFTKRFLLTVTVDTDQCSELEGLEDGDLEGAYKSTLNDSLDNIEDELIRSIQKSACVVESVLCAADNGSIWRPKPPITKGPNA